MALGDVECIDEIQQYVRVRTHGMPWKSSGISVPWPVQRNDALNTSCFKSREGVVDEHFHGSSRAMEEYDRGLSCVTTRPFCILDIKIWSNPNEPGSLLQDTLLATKFDSA